MSFETRLDRETALRWRALGLWGEETFSAVLLRRAAQSPEREAIREGARSLTYRELNEGVDRVAAHLRSLGVGEGDTVAIQLPNWIEFPLVFFALERLGALAVPLSVDFRLRELLYILHFAGCRMLICCARFRGFDHLAMAAELRPSLPELETIGVVRGEPRQGMAGLDAVVAETGAPANFEPAKESADRVMRLVFTSGTTGNPKAVMHSHNTTLAAARVLNGDLGLGPRNAMMIWLPLGLNWGYLTLVQSVLAGAKAVLLERFRPEPALEQIERERVTYIPTAPASLTAILEQPSLSKRDLSSLKIVVSGGASAPLETIRSWRRAAPGAFLELYGMLETGFHTYTRPADDPERVAGTVGREASAMNLEILDPGGRALPAGEEGEICCKGPSVHLGYLNNPAANAESFLADGWFKTGDLGVVDGNGNLRISGRVKEMINRGGMKFHPREIEEILYTHPKVLYAAVVGIPDPRLGERNCLCLVPKRGERPTLEELLAFLGDSVATYKRPERLELFEELPFTPTGKIQRHVLVREVGARLARSP